MPHYVVDKIADALNTKRKSINGSTVLIAGVAYKRDIDDMRESPALDVMGLLHARGAQVSYVDPHVPEVHGREWSGRFDIKAVSVGRGSFGQFDCIVIITDHKSFDYDAIVAESDLIVDTRNAIKKPAPKRLQARRAPARRRNSRPRLSPGGQTAGRPGSDRGQTEELGGLRPDGLEAGLELMIVVQQVQVDVRTRLRPPLNGRRIDGRVALSLKDLDWQVETRVERVVARRVSVELVVHRHQPAETVVEHVQPIRAAPSSMPRSPSARMRFPPKSSAGASNTSRSIRPASRRAAWTATNPAETRSDEHDRPRRKHLNHVLHLAEHAADRQRREVRRVEIGRVDLDTMRRQPRPEEGGLGRLRGRRQSRAGRAHASDDDLATRPAAALNRARAVGVVVVGQLFAAADVPRARESRSCRRRPARSSSGGTSG